MKALVGAFNQEKALVGAFSVIVKIDCETDGALHSTSIVARSRSWGPVKHYCHLEALYFVSKVRNIFYLELAWAGTMLGPGTRLD